MVESLPSFDSLDYLSRVGDLIESLLVEPERYAEALAVVAAGEIVARAEGNPELAEAWFALKRKLIDTGERGEWEVELPPLATAWRQHAVALGDGSEEDARAEAWEGLKDVLNLPDDALPFAEWMDSATVELEADEFLAAMENGDRDFNLSGDESGEGLDPNFGQPERVVDAEAFLAGIEGWVPPVEWPQTVVELQAIVELEAAQERAALAALAESAEDVPEAQKPPAPETPPAVPEAALPADTSPPEVEPESAVARPEEAAAAVPSVESVVPHRVTEEPPEYEIDDVPSDIVAAFTQEALEAFDQMESSMLRWEKASDSETEALREVYRLAHAIKGAANSVGWAAVGRVLHYLEDVLEDQVEGRIHGSEASAVSSLVLNTVDQLRTAVSSGAGARLSWTNEVGAQLVDDIVDWPHAATVASAKAAPVPASAKAEKVEERARKENEAEGEGAAPVASAPTIRVEVERLDGLMSLAGELLVNRHRLSRKLREVNTLRSDLGLAHEHFDRLLAEVGPRALARLEGAADDGAADGQFEVDAATLARALGEVAADARVLTGQIARHLGSFSEEAFQFTRLTQELQDEVTQARMVPLAQVWRRLERTVRNAAETEGKAIDYRAEGGDTRLDKLVLDHVFNSLLHLVRNAVAHGIESAEIRAAAGKPTAGRVTVRGRAEAGRILLEISDDGAGLNHPAILEAARHRGLVGADETVDDQACTALIFSPGLSTAKSADSVAGRGVGLDAVRAEITQLGGTVQVRSEPGVGTTFELSLPLSLAVDRIMLVQSGGQMLGLPLGLVEQVVDLAGAQWQEHDGEVRLVLADGVPIPGCHVAQVLGLKEEIATQAVIVRAGSIRWALAVDKTDEKLDVVVKSLGAILSRHPCFSGATLTGEGRVVFVVDVAKLVTLPLLPKSEVAASDPSAPSGADGAVKRNRALVVDDSPSLRMLTTRQLEGLGLEVVTAVDGQQALELLAGGNFDMVITDLEMPRMNGFELLTAMRADARWRGMPTVIVSTRESPAYRTKAAELGVLAYLIKPLSVGRLSAAVRRALLLSQGAESESVTNADCVPAQGPAEG